MTNTPRPDPKRVYGLTHQTDGTPIIRVPRVTKVSIGMPAGPQIWVAMTDSKTWFIWANQKEIVYKGTDKELAQKRYELAIDKGIAIGKNAKGEDVELKLGKGEGVIVRKFPVKLPYFTFTKPNADGTFDPDWDAIEAHGRYPTEIDVVFTDDEGLAAGYQWWGSSELKCWGDGLIGMRTHSLAITDEQKLLSADSKKLGERFFPVLDGCYTNGCEYAQPTMKNGKEQAPACKPHGRLQFQLVSALRLGGVAQFDTTGRRSTNQLFSCIQTFLKFTGAGSVDRGFLAGIPLKLVLRPFKPGKEKGIAYAVSLEFRADSITTLRNKIIEAGTMFRQAMVVEASTPAPVSRQLAAVPLSVQPGNAAAITAEFSEGEHDDDEPVTGEPKQTDSEKVAAVSDAKLQSLQERVTQARGGTVVEAAVETVIGPQPDVPSEADAADWANIDPDAPMEDVSDEEAAQYREISDADESVADLPAGQVVPVTLDDPKRKKGKG